MQRLVTCAWIVLISSTAFAGEAASNVTFMTAQPAAVGFTSWSFFWVMPEIDPDATLEYVVFQPDGEEYYRRTVPTETPTGSEIRSDFYEGFAGGNPEVFHGHAIQIMFTVDIGSIQFSESDSFHFEFTEVVEAIR